MNNKMIILIYIYCIYFPTSKRSNPYYIGQASNLEKRMKQHLKNKSLVGNALNKYDDWQITKLHTCKTRDQANLLEIEEIRNFNCVAPNGYNLTRGGEGIEGYHHTEESIEKSRQARIGKKASKETIEKQRQAHLGNKNAEGCKWSEKSKEKNRQTHIGKKASEESIEKRRGNKYAEGCKHSEESKEKNRQARIGKKASKETIEKLQQVHLGNKNALKNGKYTKEAEIKKLQTRISKLEQE